MNERVVVFGGSGFIGTYLVTELIDRKYDVTAADIYHSSFIPKENWQQCDIMDAESVLKQVEGAKFVFNLAGFANLDSANSEPKATLELNILGNLNILQACQKCKVERFIFASSAYAMSDKGSFYGISKLASEKVTEEFYRKYGLSYTIIRYGSVYGERKFSNNYIYNLIEKAMLTGKITHTGDGCEFRDYIHVADIAKLSCDILESERYRNEHVILTGVERIRRSDLFQMISEMLGGNIKVDLLDNGYENHYKATPYSFRPNRSLKLVPNPYVDMGQGLLDCMKAVEEREIEN